ncbi:E3 ubiquitin-protein ligase uhrf1 [Bulinus truncatus]|nr:E3 ubiquitin-protein ligase uhrf1 [Bulinus truncatus]
MPLFQSGFSFIRQPVAGIHAGDQGALSIALSGGYEDDVDRGECFTYTGEGGKLPKTTKAKSKNLLTASQSRDQSLTRGNLSLIKSVETGNPVRVIRGYKLNSPFALKEGYRFDGLYSVEKSEYVCGLSGHVVWKFDLRRCDGQTPPPCTVHNQQTQICDGVRLVPVLRVTNYYEVHWTPTISRRTDSAPYPAGFRCARDKNPPAWVSHACRKWVDN